MTNDFNELFWGFIDEIYDQYSKYLNQTWKFALEQAESLIKQPINDGDDDERKRVVLEVTRDFFTKSGLTFAEFIDLRKLKHDEQGEKK